MKFTFEQIKQIPDVIRDYWKLILTIIVTIGGLSTGGWHYFDKQDVVVERDVVTVERNDVKEENIQLRQIIEDLNIRYSTPVGPRQPIARSKESANTTKKIEAINKRLNKIDGKIEYNHN